MKLANISGDINVSPSVDRSAVNALAQDLDVHIYCHSHGNHAASQLTLDMPSDGHMPHYDGDDAILKALSKITDLTYSGVIDFETEEGGRWRLIYSPKNKTWLRSRPIEVWHTATKDSEHAEPSIKILPATTKDPISLMGECAGVCWGGNIENKDANYKRGIGCIESQHGRVLEYPQIYAVLDGWSARVIREWYTHIGGGPTRLQASTRYIDYGEFDYVIPPSIKNESTGEARVVYEHAMQTISDIYADLQNIGIPKEDIAMILPLGMTTRIVDRRNFRNVMDMSRQRMCSRAYHEYRRLFAAYLKALSEYSDEWKTLIEMTCAPKCEVLGYCPEKNSCGRVGPKKTDDEA